MMLMRLLLEIRYFLYPHSHGGGRLQKCIASEQTKVVVIPIFQAKPYNLASSKASKGS